MTSYVCVEIVDNVCQAWAVYTPPPSALDTLAIGKSDALLIGGSIISVFGLYVAYAVIAKAVNIL